MHRSISVLAAMVMALAGSAAGQVAILQIQVVEGEGAVHLPGSRSSHPLTVQITDDTGKPVLGAAVSFHLPEDGAGGVFANGLRTDVEATDARGRASARGIQFNRTGGRFQIRIFVSKEQARAGMASLQYIADAGPAAAKARARGRKKWYVIAAGVAAGGAVGGVLAARSGSVGSAPASGSPALTIGAPAISVGKP